MKRYAIIVPSSMGVRITPKDRQPVHTSREYYMQATSAETNVETVSASLGLPVKVLTNFVEGSPIAEFIKADLRSRNIEYEGPEIPQGGPWGYRHQFNIADCGFGLRGPRVHNDRAGEVGRILDASEFDPNIRTGGGGDTAYLRSYRRNERKNGQILSRACEVCEKARHKDIFRPELPCLILEEP